MDTGLKLFDDSLNLRLQRGFSLFLEEYERAGRDPSGMDLAGLKEELGEDMDFYVINANGVIEYTTHPPDRGLDFRKFPDFYEEVTRMRLGHEFSPPDRVVYEHSTGQVRKFAYMPPRITATCSRSGSCRVHPSRSGTGCARWRAHGSSLP